jgi:hypothetical protein
MLHCERFGSRLKFKMDDAQAVTLANSNMYINQAGIDAVLNGDFCTANFIALILSFNWRSH